MTIEQRAAAEVDDIELELADDGHGAAFRLSQNTTHHGARETETPQQRIVEVLVDAEQPLSQRQMRQLAGVRHASVGPILGKLVNEGRVEKDPAGRYRIAGTGTKK